MRRDFRESHLPPESYMAKILKSRCQKDAESGQRPQGGRENSIVVQVHMFQSLHGSQIERIYISMYKFFCDLLCFKKCSRITYTMLISYIPSTLDLNLAIIVS